MQIEMQISHADCIGVLCSNLPRKSPLFPLYFVFCYGTLYWIHLKNNLSFCCHGCCCCCCSCCWETSGSPANRHFSCIFSAFSLFSIKEKTECREPWKIRQPAKCEPELHRLLSNIPISPLFRCQCKTGKPFSFSLFILCFFFFFFAPIHFECKLCEHKKLKRFLLPSVTPFKDHNCLLYTASCQWLNVWLFTEKNNIKRKEWKQAIWWPFNN